MTLSLLAIGGPLAAAAGPDWKAVRPAIEATCIDCHNAKKDKGNVNLEAFLDDPQVKTEFALWDSVQRVVREGEMPPPDSDQLLEKEKEALIGWIDHELDLLATENEGDPGPVTMRRLTNAEYDRTIRDLTGHDYKLAAEFQTDGGGGEGFSNTGDVLFVSPAALDKYFGAARKLADHATILPGTGIVFHDHRIGLRGPVQMKAQAEQGLYVWYQQKATPLIPKDFDPMHEGAYMTACWKHLHFKTPIEELAKVPGLKLPFLQNWWKLVNGTEPKSRFLDLVRVPWRELPGPDAARPNEVPEVVKQKIARIEADLLSWNNPKKPGSGVQRRQQDSDGIRPYPMMADVKGRRQVHLCFGDLGDGNQGDIALIEKLDMKLTKGGASYPVWLRGEIDAVTKKLAAEPNSPDTKKRKDWLAKLEKTAALFGRHPKGAKIAPEQLAVLAPKVITLPLPENAVSLRAETRLDMKHNPEVDHATIQWEMTTGEPRDVTKILPGVLTVWKRSTEASRKTMGDFSVMKQAFPDMFERRLEQVADNLYRKGPGIAVYYLSDEQLGQILPPQDRKQLEAMKKDWGYTAPKKLSEQQGREWDQLVTGHLRSFAQRAWRRPLTGDEAAKLDALYHEGRARELDRESAVREVIVRVLVSPHFLFKAETLPLAEARPDGDVPLDAWDVASRLSYFVWASMPDWQLRQAAADGSLLKPEVLKAQMQRMLKDPKAVAMAEEFAGQWLKFRGFVDHTSVDEKKFPEFTPEIRADMHREVVEFFTRLFREDRPVMDVVTGDYTFLNERLAKYYGVPGVTGDEFRRVNVAQHHRGGLLGMGAVLTGTSRPHRTSPVLRGDYLYQVVLGFTAPPPPANVPELPKTADKPASLREALMRHREDQACSVCHDRIDPLGFALEGFDPIGRFRTQDEAGGEVDNTGSLKDGTSFKGLEGLRTHLAQNKADFTRQFCRKLLGYALGRQVLPTDKALIGRMQTALEKNGGKVSSAALEIVTSRQFLNRRHEMAVASNP